jgi:hypothetical protein
VPAIKALRVNLDEEGRDEDEMYRRDESDAWRASGRMVEVSMVMRADNQTVMLVEIISWTLSAAMTAKNEIGHPGNLSERPF